MASPFARAQLMAAAISAAMSLVNVGDRRAALDDIPPYQSRGKGRGGNRGTKWLGGSTRSKYMPHAGKKEQERAKRCEMVYAHATFPYGLRSAPTMQQMSKREYAAQQAAKAA